MRIGVREIGPGRPCYVIAEAGVNHNGDPELARRLVDAAADAAADAVKFQIFDPDALAAADAPKATYQMQPSVSGSTQRDMLRRLTLPADAWRMLRRRAQEHGLEFLATPFDEGSLERLLALDVPAIKIGSGDVTNCLLLEAVARTRLPVLLSTGMSTLGEVEDALDVLGGGAAPAVALFHCVSAYPAAPEDANLRAMDTLRRAFATPVGFSDHTEGIWVSIAAVAMGASLLEKHLTIDRALPGPDHAASLEAAEFCELVRAVRVAERAAGDGIKRPRPAEAEVRRVARRSLALRSATEAGTALTIGHLAALRPADGIPPTALSMVVGRRLRESRPAGHRIRWEDLG